MITRRILLCSAALAAVIGMSGPAFADPDSALAKLQETVLSKGPSGEDPSPASSVTLSDEELAKIKGMNATAAIVMHYGGNDWSRAQINGLQTEFAALGIKVIAVTDAGFKPENRSLISKQSWRRSQTSLCRSRPIHQPQRLLTRLLQKRAPSSCSWTMFLQASKLERTMYRLSRLTTTAMVSLPRI